MPQRTCIACRRTEAKRGFVRIVRTPEGKVEIDLTGKKSGRGAYLCRQTECWDAALKRDKLGHALRASVSQLDKAALEEYSKTLQGEA